MIYSIQPPEQFISMPWKNGLGNTIEILKEPIEDTNEFTWRLSMADVATDGDFSSFSGYERTLILLEGSGVTLDHENGKRNVLQKPLQTAIFCGDEKTVAKLHNGPIKDFNVMTRRGHCKANIQTNRTSGKSILKVNANLLLLYAVEDSVTINVLKNKPILLKHKHLFITRSPNFSSIECIGSSYISIQVFYAKKKCFQDYIEH